MRRLRTIATSVVVSLVLLVSGATPVFAGGSLMDRLRRTGGAAGYSAETTATTLATIIGRIINVASSLLGVIFVAQMVYAGYLWMTARGEEEQLEKAKHIIRRSIVGLAIVLGAWAITRFVLTQFYAAAAPVSAPPG
ncbi:MAG: pilin [bacterium]|nr:pilin [bacterium]